MRPFRSAVVVGMCTAGLLGAAVPANAASAQRTLVNAHISISGVQNSLPRGATISVLQYCPSGSRLDQASTGTVQREVDRTVLDRRVRLTSRELWPAGLVSRYRVTRRTSGEPLVLLNLALCTSTVPGDATTVTGRAATDLRVWGPAPSGRNLINSTTAAVTDSVDSEHVFATAMKAAGVASAKGSLANGVKALQEVVQESEIGAVVAVGQTQRRVRRGTFISMRNTYSYTSDLTRKVTETPSEL